MSYAGSSGGVDGVGDGGCRSDVTEHPDTLDSLRQVIVDFVDHDYIKVRHVHLCRNKVVAEARPDDPARTGIGQRFLVKRHADAADEATDVLRAGKGRIDDPAGREGCGHAPDAQHGGATINRDFSEHGSEAHTRRQGLRRQARFRRRPFEVG